MAVDLTVLAVLLAVFVVLLIIYLLYDRHTKERQRQHFEEVRPEAAKRFEELTRELLDNMEVNDAQGQNTVPTKKSGEQVRKRGDSH